MARGWIFAKLIAVRPSGNPYLKGEGRVVGADVPSILLIEVGVGGMYSRQPRRHLAYRLLRGTTGTTVSLTNMLPSLAAHGKQLAERSNR
jgi:hypothetical protein